MGKHHLIERRVIKKTKDYSVMPIWPARETNPMIT